MTEDEIRNMKEVTRRLRREGKIECARKELICAADLGVVDAMVELADLARDQGNLTDSNKWIEKAEASVNPGSAWDHLELVRAFNLGLGKDNNTEDARRRELYHLEQAGLAGNVFAQESLALRYLQGMNGCKKDLVEFEKWISRAVKSNSPRAAYIYAEHLLEYGKDVPEYLVETLVSSKDDNKLITQLLQRIEKKRRTLR